MTNKQKQLNLYCLNYFHGWILGFWGCLSREASKEFCTYYEIPLDSRCEGETLEMLLIVWRDIQARLNKLGYELTIDGVVGDKTKRAVEDFKRAYDLRADSIMDKEAIKLLEKLTDTDPLQITEHVHLDHIRCACKGAYCNTMNGMTEIQAVETAREIAEVYERGYALIQERYPTSDGSDRAVIIRSGIRCPEQNKKVGGAGGSYHLQGIALDVDAQGISSGPIWDEVNPNGGVGTGGGHYPHIDSRGKRARWKY